MAVGNQACDQIDQEVDGTAMAGMLDLTDVFELISDGLDDGSFAQEEFVGPIEQAVVHLLRSLVIRCSPWVTRAAGPEAGRDSLCPQRVCPRVLWPA